MGGLEVQHVSVVTAALILTHVRSAHQLHLFT